mmetsp:Transcript_58872/g.133280  ORF Transcript_58872/g.133280 Transcript_58872/m.133280 type:complete len:166 (-) Transcript_58872:9-506(-)
MPSRRDLFRHMDTDRGLRLPHLPYGRFLNVPPTEPVSDWSTDQGTPWWQNKDLIIGKLTSKTRKVYIMNVLTQQQDLLTVCSEETITEIQDRYLEYNQHAKSYTWKKLADESSGGPSPFVKLDMSLTLADNKIPDDDGEFEALEIDDGFYYPTLHVYFNDDLTYA